MTQRVLIHARANPLHGIRPLARRLKLALAMKSGGINVALASPPIPGRIRWRIRREGFSLEELPPAQSPTDVASGLWSISARMRAKVLVIDDACPQLVQEVSRLKPADSVIVLLGTPHKQVEVASLDLYTAHRPEFHLRSDSGSLSGPAPPRDNCRRLLVEAQRLPGTTLIWLISQIAKMLMVGDAGKWPFIDVLSSPGLRLLEKLPLSAEQLRQIRMCSSADRIDWQRENRMWSFFSDPEEFHDHLAGGQAGTLLASTETLPAHPLSGNADTAPWIVDCSRSGGKRRLVEWISANQKMAAGNSQLEQARQTCDDHGAARLVQAIGQLPVLARLQRTA